MSEEEAKENIELLSLLKDVRRRAMKHVVHRLFCCEPEGLLHYRCHELEGRLNITTTNLIQLVIFRIPFYLPSLKSHFWVLLDEFYRRIELFQSDHFLEYQFLRFGDCGGIKHQFTE